MSLAADLRFNRGRGANPKEGGGANLLYGQTFPKIVGF